VTDCLPRNALPSVLQDAARRLPRKSPRQAKTGTGYASRGRSAAPQNHANNYLAEASAMRRDSQTSPLGGRNRKGAGAPLRNRNARGARSLRLHIALKKRLRTDHLQLLVLSAAVTHLERRLAPQNMARALQDHHKNLQNNYLAEARSYAPPDALKGWRSSAPDLNHVENRANPKSCLARPASRRCGLEL